MVRQTELVIITIVTGHRLIKYMDNRYSIVLVHQGNEFVDYINDCITQILKFNNCKIFIASNKIHQNKIINDDLVSFVSIEELEKTENHNSFNKTKGYDVNFRDGFWKSVTERFLIIEEVMIKFSLSNVFHFESPKTNSDPDSGTGPTPPVTVLRVKPIAGAYSREHCPRVYAICRPELG